MRTYVPKEGEISREWVVMDAADQVLGRLATEVARILRGKHKPDYTPHLDTGDFVVIVNAERVHLTGAKLDDKVYYRHSGRPGRRQGLLSTFRPPWIAEIGDRPRAARQVS